MSVDLSNVTPYYKLTDEHRRDYHTVRFAKAESDGRPPTGYRSITDPQPRDDVAILEIYNAHISDADLKLFISKFSLPDEIELMLSNCTVYPANGEKSVNYCTKVKKLTISSGDGSSRKLVRQILFLTSLASTLPELTFSIFNCDINVLHGILFALFKSKTLKNARIVVFSWTDSGIEEGMRSVGHDTAVRLNNSIKSFSLEDHNKQTGKPILQKFIDGFVLNKTITSLKIVGFSPEKDDAAPFADLLRNTTLKSLILEPFIPDFYDKDLQYYETLQRNVLDSILLNRNLNELKYNIVTKLKDTQTDDTYADSIVKFMQNSEYKDVPYRCTNYHILSVLHETRVIPGILGVFILGTFYDKLFHNKYGPNTDQERMFALARAPASANVNSSAHGVHDVILRNIAGFLSEPSKRISDRDLFNQWRIKHGIETDGDLTFGAGANQQTSVTFVIPNEKVYPLRDRRMLRSARNMAEVRIIKGFLKNNGIDESEISVQHANNDTFINNKWRKALKDIIVDPLPTSVSRDPVFLNLPEII